MTSKPFAFMDIPSAVNAIASMRPRLLLFIFLIVAISSRFVLAKVESVHEHVVRPYKVDMMEGQGAAADTVILSINDVIAHCTFTQLSTVDILVT